MTQETVETLQMLGVAGLMLAGVGIFHLFGAGQRKESRREDAYLAGLRRGESPEQARASAETIVRRRS